MTLGLGGCGLPLGGIWQHELAFRPFLSSLWPEWRPFARTLGAVWTEAEGQQQKLECVEAHSLGVTLFWSDSQAEAEKTEDWDYLQSNRGRPD